MLDHLRRGLLLSDIHIIVAVFCIACILLVIQRTQVLVYVCTNFHLNARKITRKQASKRLQQYTV